jgi:hypothetical protein
MADDWLVSWHHTILGVPDLWRENNFGDGVTIALLDTGLASPWGLDRIDFEYLDAHGTKVQTTDREGHGTYCGSAIASYRAGCLGIAPHAKIVSMRVVDTGTSVTDVQAAFEYVLQRPDIDILSCSFVLASAPSALRDLVHALTLAGKVVISAAGDKNTPSPFPEDVPGAITVAAVNEARRPLDGARTGNWIDVAAPGADIPVLATNGTVAYFGQSSAAAAVTSGVVALALAAHRGPERRAVGQKMEHLLKVSATALPGDAPAAVGAGLINPAALLAASKNVAAAPVG